MDDLLDREVLIFGQISLCIDGEYLIDLLLRFGLSTKLSSRDLLNGLASTLRKLLRIWVLWVHAWRCTLQDIRAMRFRQARCSAEATTIYSA